MVDSRLMRPSKIAVPGQTECRIKEPTVPHQEGQDKKQHKTHISMDSRTNSKTVATSKQRSSLERTKSGVDLCDTLNTKQNQDEDLRSELNGRKTVVVSKVIHVASVNHTARSEQREVALGTRLHSLEKLRDWTHQRSLGH